MKPIFLIILLVSFIASADDQSGRVYFMAHTTLKSLYVYPSALNAIGDDLDGQVVAGMALLAGGGSLYGSYIFSKDRELGYGRVAFMNYGGELLGISYPNLLGTFLHNATNVDEKDNYESVHKSEKITAIAAAIGFPAGIYLGSKVNFTGNNQYGNASIMTDLSRWAYLYGYLLPLYSDDLPERSYFATASGLTMCLLPAGFYLGYRIVENNDYSPGRSFMVTSGGIMGAITGALIPTLVESDEDKFYITSTLVGQISGTVFGFNFYKENDYSFGQGAFMSLSAIGGAAIALSIPLMAQSGEHRFYTVMGLAGGWSGFIIGEKLSRSIFDYSERDKRAESKISFPVLWQWPLVLGSNLAEKKFDHKTGIVPVAEIIRINL